MNFYWLIDNEVAGHSEPVTISDLEALHQKGIKALVRMSEHPKVTSDKIKQSGIETDLHEPVPDFNAPSQKQLNKMVDFMVDSVWHGKPVGVSCGAGIGRTGTVLACYLAKRNSSSKGFVIEVRRKRAGAVETDSQMKAVDAYVSSIQSVEQQQEPQKATIQTTSYVIPPQIKTALAKIYKKYGLQLASQSSSNDDNALLINSLKMIAEKYNYGRTWEYHVEHVTDITLQIYAEFHRLGFFTGSPGRDLLEASCWLHDIGVKKGENDHNVNSFDIVSLELQSGPLVVLTPAQKTIILCCVLWHRGDLWKTLEEFGKCPDVKTDNTLQFGTCFLAGILRIADGLCYPSGHPVQKATVSVNANTVYIDAIPTNSGDSLSLQLSKANSKTDLLSQTLEAEVKVRLAGSSA